MTFIYPVDSNKAHPLPLSPEYKSSIKRAPNKPLIPMRHTLSELTGPVYGHETVREGDSDLTTQHKRRADRRAHHRARPCARRGRPRRAQLAGRDLAGQFLRPLRPRPRPASGAARSEFHGRGPHASAMPLATTASSPSSRAPIPGAITTMPGVPPTSISRCSAIPSSRAW